jgi:urease accessory protein UreE
MSLTKSQSVDLIEVTGQNIQVRTATIIKEDDTELSRSFHRHVLQPGDDLTEQDPKVVAIATAVWSL